MLSLMCAIALALPCPQTREPAPATPERIAAAVKELEAAFSKGKPEERAAAIVSNQEVVDAQVVAWFVKGLKSGDKPVRDAAAEALRFARHPDALSALQDALKRERKLGKDLEFLTRLTKCVGQHQSESSIELLADNVFQPREHRLIEARILALGNIRSRRACEELIGLMRTADRERVQPFMEAFRLALMSITGVDQGLSQDAWMAWWNNSKSTFEPPRPAPPLPREMQRRWNYYWGLDAPKGREKRRGERGDDPEERSEEPL